MLLNKSSDFLSQAEVEALLLSVCNTETKEENPTIDKIKKYNLGHQERIVRGRMPTLELINEYFARIFRKKMFKRFQKNCELSVGPIRVQKYCEFLRNLVVPTNLNIIGFKNSLHGNGLVVFDPNFVFLMVDHIFGGDGRFHNRVEGRDFTEIENVIIDQIFNTFKKSYLKSFRKYYHLKMEQVGREMNTQFALIASPGEIVVSTSFTIELGGCSADFHICIPYVTIEPILNVLQNTFSSDEKNIGTVINYSLIPNKLCVNAEINNLTLNDLSELKIGQILYFDNYSVDVEGSKLFSGKIVNNEFHIGEKNERK